MATNFPNSPSNGDTHTFGGATYTYNSSMGAWTGPSTTAGGASVTVSETAPSSPAEGDLWFDPSVLKTFVYYNDGTANQWVQSNPTGGGSSSSGGASVTVSETAPTSPSAGDLWWSSSEAVMYIYYTDTDSSQWVSTSTPGATGADGAAATGYGQLPIVYTEPPTSHTLNNDGTTSTVQMQAVDPEGTAITYGIAYANSTNALPDQLGSATTINQTTGTYTFTPTTTQANAGTFKARLSASDGITSATRFVNFSLAFAATVDYLVVAGGGAGGGTPNGAGCGGGGAGGLIYTTGQSFPNGTTYNIVVGAGGTGAQNAGGDGGNSSISATGFTTVTAIGGGGGGGSSAAGRSGGSGGGSAYNSSVVGTGTSGQGNNGGNNGSGTSNYPAGGGGGAGAVGGNASGSTAGSGGDGLEISITGTATYYAGGGGGSSRGTGGAGGQGGGAAGPGTGGNINGTAATANTGGGGSGAQGTGTGGNGGSGIIIIRTTATAASTTGSPTVTTDGSYNIYSFTADGSITF